MRNFQFCTLTDGKISIKVPSNLFRTIRTWGSTGIPKKELKSNHTAYANANVIVRIKERFFLHLEN